MKCIENDIGNTIELYNVNDIKRILIRKGQLLVNVRLLFYDQKKKRKKNTKAFKQKNHLSVQQQFLLLLLCVPNRAPQTKQIIHIE